MTGILQYLSYTPDISYFFEGVCSQSPVLDLEKNLAVETGNLDSITTHLCHGNENFATKWFKDLSLFVRLEIEV